MRQTRQQQWGGLIDPFIDPAPAQHTLQAASLPHQHTLLLRQGGWIETAAASLVEQQLQVHERHTQNIEVRLLLCHKAGGAHQHQIAAAATALNHHGGQDITCCCCMAQTEAQAATFRPW